MNCEVEDKLLHCITGSVVTRIEIKKGTFMYVWNILRGLNKAVTQQRPQQYNYV